MNIGEITVPVKVDIKIDKATAETCLKIIELYVNSNPEVILASKREDGSTEYRLVVFGNG